MPTALSSPPANPLAPRAAAQWAWDTIRLFLWPLGWKKIPALRCLLLRICGAKTTLKSQLSRTCIVESPWQLTMGEYCAIGRRVILQNTSGLTIGDRTIISQDAHVCGVEPGPTPGTFTPISRPIVIGSDVWIAAGAYIGPGVTIGDGAVVAACSVVTTDVAPWTVVAGHPLQTIKPRTLREGIAS